MNTPEQQQIDHWLSNSQFQIDNKWNLYHSGFYKEEDLPVQGMYTSLASFYSSLARAQFLNGDPIGTVRESFSQAAQHMLKNFQMAYDESDSDFQGEQLDLSSIVEAFYIEGVNYALMGANFALAKDLSVLFRDSPDGDSMGKDVNRYSHALAFTLRDREDEARPLLQAQLDDYKTRPPKTAGDKNYHTLIYALCGILDRSEIVFNDALLSQCTFYTSYARGEYKDTTEEFICDHAVALANLGINKGLKVTVEHELIPQGLLIK